MPKLIPYNVASNFDLVKITCNIILFANFKLEFYFDIFVATSINICIKILKMFLHITIIWFLTAYKCSYAKT